jgi:ATP-dependent metalloprotease
LIFLFFFEKLSRKIIINFLYFFFIYRINSAALIAANRGADQVEMPDVEEARDKVIMGPAKKSKVQQEEKLKLTAYHEGGHTLAALLTKGADPVHKVTILPRGFSGGATYSLPRDEDYHTKQNIVAAIDVCMGGRAAEELVNGADFITTGAGMDMRQASSLARRYVMNYSMSDLGLSFYSVDDSTAKPSPEKQAIIDAEVEKILQTSYKRVVSLLRERRSDLDSLAKALLEYETLSAEECKEVIAGRPLPALRAKSSQPPHPPSSDKPGKETKQSKSTNSSSKQPNEAIPKVGGVWTMETMKLENQSSSSPPTMS